MEHILVAQNISKSYGNYMAFTNYLSRNPQKLHLWPLGFQWGRKNCLYPHHQSNHLPQCWKSVVSGKTVEFKHALSPRT